MAEIAIRNKLVVKDLGDPKAILALPESTKRLVLGTIIGIASGVMRRQDRNVPDRTNEALTGDFEGVPADPKRDGIASGVLYLPDGAFKMIASKLEGENAAQSVQFALEVAVFRATNAAGYSYELTPKIKATAANPLDALKAEAGLLQITKK